MTLQYEVRQLPVRPEIQQIRLESRGSRRKFWISIEGEPNLWLLKYPRPNTGEHRAEKIAAEVGKLIGVECARVELADCGGELVTICESFEPGNRREVDQYVNEAWDWYDDEAFFVDGCYVLAWYDHQHDVETRFGQQGHNVVNIVRAVKDLFRDPGFPADGRVDDILHSLASYALIDGLIGNTDRHHENWMLKIVLPGASATAWMSLAPSYDHASSLGRELRDSRRTRILESDGILDYIYRGRGGVYLSESAERAPAPLVIAQWLCKRWPEFTRRTLECISCVDDAEFHTIVDRLPSHFTSEVAKEFAYEVLVTSKAELTRNL